MASIPEGQEEEDVVVGRPQPQPGDSGSGRVGEITDRVQDLDMLRSAANPGNLGVPTGGEGGEVGRMVRRRRRRDAKESSSDDLRCFIKVVVSVDGKAYSVPKSYSYPFFRYGLTA